VDYPEILETATHPPILGMLPSAIAAAQIVDSG
jgi:hypothetical protein